MRGLLHAGVALLAWGVALMPAQAAMPAPEKLYGGKILFDILRNGDLIGSQQVTLRQEGHVLTVSQVADIVVRVLFIPVYRFHSEGATQWHGGQLLDMKTTTNDNGKVTAVTARDDGGKLTIDGPAGKFQAPESVITMEHWNAAELQQTIMLNTLTGKLDRIEIHDEGPDQVPAPEGQRAVRRFSYQGGDLKLTAFYDAAGHWAGLRFLASDGSRIEYVCRRCGSPPG
jgi:hypothetical protein